MKDKKDAISPKLVKETISFIVESLYTNEILSDKDIKDKDSLVIALKKFLKEGGIGGFIVDHRDALIVQAEYFFQKSQYDYSKMFYATFFEHSINHLIDIHCSRKRISSQAKVEIIRNIYLWGKLTWLLELIDLPKFNKEYLKVIKLLADERNAFIHYKWNPDDDFEKIPNLENENQKINIEFEKIRKAVRYFKLYESRLKFKGKKAKIKDII